jgi:carboxyl-terminal processing protease
MVVLTNSGTAGVPEMLANALRAYRRAGLVGGQTAGGIELSRVEELPSGGLLQIAYARYVTPDGRLAPVAGMEPDVAVELPELATLRQGRDVYLEAATEALQNNPRW